MEIWKVRAPCRFFAKIRFWLITPGPAPFPFRSRLWGRSGPDLAGGSIWLHVPGVLGPFPTPCDRGFGGGAGRIHDGTILVGPKGGGAAKGALYLAINL